MQRLTSEQKNQVLDSMARLLKEEQETIIGANQADLENFGKGDQALYDRLVVDAAKVDGMIQAVKEVREQADPVGLERSSVKLDNGLDISNRTAPFGTILIIYESRPDVTIEAAVLAFKAGSRILLKGGKEAIHTNRVLLRCWHKALTEHNLSEEWIQLLQLNREETRAFLQNPDQKLDLIVPRGGERLIAFVKEHARCAVLVSGRGNNFAYVAPDADWELTKKVILNAKTHKISACNALDKVLIDKNLPDFERRLSELDDLFKEGEVEVLASPALRALLPGSEAIISDDVWYEEFLAKKIAVDEVDGLEKAIDRINQYSGGHSSIIFTADRASAAEFMEQVDTAAVYHNASTRFTDGGQMGVGAELAISTDKLHHRGPLGLEQLVTNKYYVFGNGQIRG